MKQKRFEDQIRESAALHKGAVILGQRTNRSWPVCGTCRYEVEAVELKDMTATSCELWARCHGKEDHCKVRFPFRIEGDPLEDERANWAIKRAMADYTPFTTTDVYERPRIIL